MRTCVGIFFDYADTDNDYADTFRKFEDFSLILKEQSGETKWSI